MHKYIRFTVEQLEVQYHAGSVTSTTAEHHCEGNAVF